MCPHATVSRRSATRAKCLLSTSAHVLKEAQTTAYAAKRRFFCPFGSGLEGDLKEGYHHAWIRAECANAHSLLRLLFANSLNSSPVSRIGLLRITTEVLRQLTRPLKSGPKWCSHSYFLKIMHTFPRPFVSAIPLQDLVITYA
jgi:hypothetical protein